MEKKAIKNVLLILGVLLLLPGIAYAAEFRSGDTVVISKGEVIDDDLYICGGNIVIDGMVNGDLVGAGGSIKIKGKVADDLIVAGGTITIEGDVGDDIRVAGGNIVIDSSVVGDAMVAGGNIEISEDIGGDVIVAGKNIIIAGDISRNLKVKGGRTVLGGIIGGDASITSDTLELLQTAEIKGDLVYTSKESAKIQEGAVVRGETTHVIPEKPAKKAGFPIITKIFWFLALFVIGALLVHFAPKASVKVADVISASPWKSLGIGFASLIAIPIGIIIFMVTVVGIPLALITLILYVIGLYFSKIFVGLLIGKKTLKRFYKKKSSSLLWALFIGLVILTILTSIPILGWLISFVVMILGIGAILLVDMDLYREGRSKDII